MNPPTDYLAAAWQPAPDDWPPDGIPYVPKAQAERALALQAADMQAALARTRQYHERLARAIRNAKSPQAP